MNLSEFLRAKATKRKKINAIPEGKRNTTLCSYAAKVVKRFGITDGKAYQAFLDESAKCSPLLGEDELQKIWSGAESLYVEKIQNSTDYVPPKQYNATNQVVELQLPIADETALTALFKMKEEKRRFSIATARLFLQVHAITIKLNEMSNRAEIEGLPTQYSGENACNLINTLIADTASTLAFKRPAMSTVHEILTVIVNENRFHPVVELLKSEPWDGFDRLPEIYRLLGLTDEFHKVLVKKWALQSIAILYNLEESPISTQGVLVLQGEQGLGKTQFFRHLAIHDSFFKGGATLDMGNKDSIMSATRVWICELGEIDSTTKKEQSALKAFLTESTDRYREPYARCEVVRLRRTSFCGTVNPKGYLRDESGNRRYWTVPVVNIDLDKVFEYTPEWYTQFWRQIHAEYLQNPKGYLLTREEQEQVNARNSEYETDSYGEDEFMSFFDTTADRSHWTDWKTAAEIADLLNDNFKGLKISSSNIGKLLNSRIEKRVGKPFERRAVNGKRQILCPPKSSGSPVPNVPLLNSVLPVAIMPTTNTADDSAVEL
jgi:predicted P-loop ATPase